MEQRSGPRASAPGPGPLPGWKIVVFGLGSFASTLMTTVIVTWLLYYASGSDGGSSGAGHGILGLAMAIGRIADALADPFVGHWSDRTRTRIGQRLPFVLGGLIPMVLLFGLLWVPYAGVPLMVRAIRLSLTLTAFFTLYTVVVCPYLAMLPEITDDPATRIRLATWQAGGSVAGGGAMIILSARLFSTVGFSGGAVVVAGMVVMCFALVGLAFLRGPRREAPARPPRDGNWAEPLAAAWRLVSGERAFGMYLLGVAALWVGLNIISISLPYVVTVVLRLPSSGLARLGVVSVLGTVLVVPWIGRVVARHGKVKALRAAALLLAIALPLIALGPMGAWIAVISTGPGLAFVYTLPHPILAEITDRHRRRHGDGEEALHFGAQGMALKGALAVAAWVTGLLFAQLGAGPDAMEGIRVASIVAGVLCLAAVWVLGQVGRELRREG